MYDSSGTLLGVLGIGHDITERKQIEVALKESNERLNVILENNPIAIWDWDLITDKWYATQKYYTMLGYEPETGYPDRTVWLNRIHPDDRELVRQKIANVLNHTDEHYSYDARMLHADGSYRWQTVMGQAVERSDDGNVSHMIGVRIDIDDRKQAEAEIIKLNESLERRIVERTAQLEAANKELEAFSYSVSHDLRAPLRHISGFADMLSKDSKDKLPEKSQHYLHVINDSTRKMGSLIDDLLSFSRTGRAEMKKDTFSMNKAVEDALLQVKNSISDRKIIWNIGNLPEVFGDYNLICLAWVNLLDNAVKYSKTREEAVIHINCTNDTDEYVFSIRDNGVGFDMQYANKLFGVFQRLHTSSEFEGTGIGLANVRRIILRHGGRTWAEAEIDKGATFYFSLPK